MTTQRDRIPDWVHAAFNALMFFTRVPVPRWVRYSPEKLNQSAAWFPLVGWLVGAVAALCYLATRPLFGDLTALLLSLAATVLLTGAFHEDGLADVCDGFGGGWNRQQVLTIMKDSRLGTYGAVGLALVLALKVSALAALPRTWPAVVLVVGHVLSRFFPVLIIYRGTYGREDLTSKVKPLATRLSTPGVVLAAFFTLPVLVFYPVPAALAFGGAGLTTLYLARLFHKRLGGYTGDCLGTVQQLTELTVILVFLAWYRLALH
ncbi:adenosylcobinamide-GDP ribazoletransferase [Acanthopleuribacter pedis]|uniref:Adenosylcobinamide-GDP ribazoletransferase n=1 Tax=Acanthopleuribacter pedis TaxID=442870 RepID=A0A8J7QCB7_9BACT|nr:adenosylcobinamide-GDP ribazoletransferase [Acanthopleuribacter pedis]